MQGDIEDNHNSGSPSRAGTSQAHYTNGSGRRQTGRGGSDGPLSPGRSLLGEGLRAAGIGTRRRDIGAPDDPFEIIHAAHAPPARRTRSTGANSVVQGGNEWDSPAQGRPISRLGDQSGARLPEYTTPDTRRFGDRPPSSATSSTRPGTSMAALHHDSSATAGPRATPGPSRASTSSAFLRESHVEHRRLMLEALSMFQSHLSRLPPMGQTSTTTIPDVFQNSQHVVHSLDKLNNLLRAASGKALQSQIEAEVGDGDSMLTEIAEIWANIGADSREQLRVSDEIVRTMTQLLLGIAKIMRDTVGASTAQQHARSVSMDEEIGRRLTPEISSATSDKRSSDGRRSRETRRSWESRESAQALSRVGSTDRTSNSTSSRPPSSAQLPSHSSAASSSDRRSPGERSVEQTTPATRNVSSALSSVSSRRLYTPRDRIASDSSRTAVLISSIDSQDTIQGYEPSPTPASRQGQATRSRALPPLAIPPSLPTLLSESLLNRSSPATSLEGSRRKVSSNSNITVRAEPSLPSVIKPPNATTALTTTTVSDADVVGPSPSTRSDSENSTGVTFSRPSAASSSTLNSLRRKDASVSRARTVPDYLKEELRSPMSGSETERPRTVGIRGRTSLDGPRSDSMGRNSPASSTLTSLRRERRRTITEIFAQADQ